MIRTVSPIFDGSDPSTYQIHEPKFTAGSNQCWSIRTRHKISQLHTCITGYIIGYHWTALDIIKQTQNSPGTNAKNTTPDSPHKAVWRRRPTCMEDLETSAVGAAAPNMGYADHCPKKKHMFLNQKNHILYLQVKSIYKTTSPTIIPKVWLETKI